MFTPASAAAVCLLVALVAIAKNSPKGRLVRLLTLLECGAGLLLCAAAQFDVQGPAKVVAYAVAGAGLLAALVLLVSRHRRLRQLEPLQYRSDAATR